MTFPSSQTTALFWLSFSPLKLKSSTDFPQFYFQEDMWKSGLVISTAEVNRLECLSWTAENYTLEMDLLKRECQSSYRSPVLWGMQYETSNIFMQAKLFHLFSHLWFYMSDDKLGKFFTFQTHTVTIKLIPSFTLDHSSAFSCERHSLQPYFENYFIFS